jgi:hypothetical protein
VLTQRRKVEGVDWRVESDEVPAQRFHYPTLPTFSHLRFCTFVSFLLSPTRDHLLAQGIPFNAKLAGTSLVPLNPAWKPNDDVPPLGILPL